MNRWAILGAIAFGTVFALFAFWRIEPVDARGVRLVIGAFLFGCYCAIVICGSGKPRSLSLPAQTLLGVAVACAIAALLAVPPEGYLVAIVLGLVLGATAHWWAEHLPLP